MDEKTTEFEEPFDTAQIGRVLTSVSGGLASKLRDHMVHAVDAMLRDQFVDVVNLNSLGALGAPQVMIRVRTLQTILDEFRRLFAKKYPELLEHIGRNIGFNFGISLIRILRSAKRIPLDFSALLGFWARFDTAAQMGHFVFEFEDRDDGSAVITAHIRDLFVTLGYGDDEPLRHGSLMTGYLVGAADAASLLWSRWLRGSVFQNPVRYWSAVGCLSRGQERDGASAFSLELREERLPAVRDGFVHAIEACEARKSRDSMIGARICMEKSILRVAGYPADTRFSFGRLLEQLEKVRADLKYEQWKAAYDACSVFAHEDPEHNEARAATKQNEVEVLDYLFNVWECIREAEATEMSEEQKVNLKTQSARYLMT
jgi:hypothetical protein